MVATLQHVLEKRNIVQQHQHWYVLDDSFSWDIKSLYHSTFKYLGTPIQTPVIFCPILEANKIISDLGDEEDEYLRFAAGIYWRELELIFIFQYDEMVPLMETLFHEFRHVLQERDPAFKQHFETDKKLPYQERLTEIDAFQYAKEKLNAYLAGEGSADTNSKAL